MPNLRQQLAAARDTLRRAKDALETAKTVATLEVQGKNEAERKSNTALALLNDHAYAHALVYVRDCEALVERVEADIAEQEYQLRVREVAARERTEEEHALRLREVAAREQLAEALLGKRVDDGVVDRIAFEAGRVAGRQVAHEMRRQGGAVFDEVAFEEARTKRIDDLYPPQPADYTKVDSIDWYKER